MAVVWADLFPTKGQSIRTAIALIVVVSAALLATDALSSADQQAPPGPPCFGRSFTAKQSRPFIERVWDTRHWSRGSPSHKALEAWHKRLQCPAGPGHLKALRTRWRASQKAFYEYRKQKLWVKEFKPYVYPDGSHWAAPYPIAWCESGGDYYASPAGAYGEVAPYPQNQPPRVQDEIAHQLMQEGKEYSAWVEWEGGCAYR